MSNALLAITPEKPDNVGEPASRLTGRLGVLAIVLTVMGYMAPLGAAAGYIPLVIGYGNGVGAPLSFLVVGIMLAIFSVGYTAMIRAVPRPGAFYTYVTAGLGKPIGVGAGFLAVALYILAGAGFAIFAGLATRDFVLNLSGIELPWWLYVTTYSAISAFCSYRGADFNARILGFVVLFEIIVLCAFVLFAALHNGLTAAPFSYAAFSSGSLAIGILFASMVFGGFEGVAIYREEVKKPDRTIPRATFALIVILTLLFGLTSWALISLIGTQNVVSAAANNPASFFNEVIKGEAGYTLSVIVAGLTLISALASQLATVNATSRYLYSLSSDRLLPHRLSVAHSRFHSPHRTAILTVAIFTLLILTVALTGTDPTAAYVAFGGVGIFAFEALLLLVCVSCIVFFTKDRRGFSALRVILAPSISAIAIIALLWLSATQAELLLGVPTTITAMGFSFVVGAFIIGCIYAIWLRTFRPGVFAGIGRETA